MSKKSKRVLAITSVALLLLVLAFILLSRNTGKDIVYSPAPISLKLRNQLDADFADYINDYYMPDWCSEDNVRSSCRIYGSDNGYTIFCYVGGMTFGGRGQAVGDQAFSGTPRLYAYKSGKFIDLADAYEQGLVSREAIVTARDYHNQFVGEDMIAECCPGVVNRYAMRDIEEAWRKMGNETFGTWYTTGDADADWRCYDIESYSMGTGIIMYFGGDQEQTFTTITLGDYTFSHPTGFKIYYLYDKDLIDLTTVEDLEIYSTALQFAQEQHIQCNNLVFGEGWDS